MDDNLGDAEARTRLAALDDAEFERIFSARELQSLHFGNRERVTDLELARIRDAVLVAAAVCRLTALGRHPNTV